MEAEDKDKRREAVLGKISAIVKTCPSFGNWDECQDKCPLKRVNLYMFCDSIYATQNIEKMKEMGV